MYDEEKEEWRVREAFTNFRIRQTIHKERVYKKGISKQPQA